MEVHAHSHTARKKWTHYLWEFLMLFLAVFCGFLAETKREHIVEKHRAKEYAKSLLSDIRNDTAELKQGLFETKFTISSIDSVLSIAQSISPNKSVSGKFYYYSKFTTDFYRIDWNKSTMDQIIQSGNLRYFADKNLVQKINQYYAFENALFVSNQSHALHRDKLMETLNRIVQSRYFILFANMKPPLENNILSAYPQLDSLIAMQFPLQQGSEKLMDEYFNEIIRYKSRLSPFIEIYYPKAISDAEEIMHLLTSYYHLK